MHFPKLNFAQTFDFKITKLASNQYLIFDPIRRKNVPLTSEEWVRQHFLEYLKELKLNKSQIVVEKQFNLFDTKKRLDTMVLKKNEPYILFEFKAPSIELNPSHLDQVLRYNAHFKAPYVLVSNGLQHLLLERIPDGSYTYLNNEKELLGGILS